MVGEGTTAIFITFLLAIIGYVGLTTVVIKSIRGAVPVGLWRAVAAVIVTHVGMVWTFRYGWDFSLSVRNGYAGFAMFHGALALIITSVFVGERTARRLIHIAFGIVTVGALGASFIYDVVANYRIPVILCALIGSGGLGWYYLPKRPGRAAVG